MSVLRSRLTAGLAGGALVAAGLTLVGPPDATAHPDSHRAQTVQVRVSADHAVHLRKHVRPGVKRFVVHSAGDAGLQLIRPHRGYTKAELAADLNAGFGGNAAAFERFEHHVTLLGGVSSSAEEKGEFWLRLRRGRYWAVDTEGDGLEASKVRTFVVTGHLAPGRARRRDVTLRAVGATTWAARPRSIPGSGVLSFRNRSSENHFVILARLEDGKTVEDFADWIEQVQQDESLDPPVEETGGLDTGVVGPGRKIALRYDLPAGDYVLVCFWPDADMNMTPHAFMGMFRGIEVR
ncbi:MAG: hypothetical protein WB441_01480 [Nocardioidaceae bacterium]